MANSQTRSRKQFTGTVAERAALDTTNVRVGDTFLESDTGDEHEWFGVSWYLFRSGGAPATIGIGAGVPGDFTKLTSNTASGIINKGNLNKIKFTPRILNEHAESSREVQGIVSSGNIVGQIFKASKDNISALMLTLESAGGVVVDNFEGYADSAALQAAWVETGALATLEEVIVKTGSKAMSLPTTNVADEWERTAAPANYTDYTGTFSAYFSHAVSQQQISIYIGDGVNTKSLALSQVSPGVWQDFEVNENAMNEDGGGTTNIEAITVIGYRIVAKRTGGTVIIDDLESVPHPGSVKVKLWDMGPDVPVSTTTRIDDGTQYEKIGVAEAASYDIPLVGGKKIYHVHMFTAGINKAVPSNELLNIDHYYLFQLEYVDTDVSVYGPDTSFNTNYYENGYAFTAPDEATAITAIGDYSDLMFGIFSTQDVYFTSISWRFDAEPNGSSSIHVFLEDAGMIITDIIVDHEVSPEQEFTADVSLRPMFLEAGGKLEFYYDDDYSDSVSIVIGEATFLYAPPVVNG